MPSLPTPHRWQTLLAFAVIYFVWGSTFLCIRIGVHEVPPLIYAGIRFFAAGLLMFAWLTARGERIGRAREWGSVFVLALLIFVLDYGCLFWAEKRVASGVAAVMLATIPAFMALSEIFLLRTQRLTARLALALLIGVTGVVVLMSHSLEIGGAPIDRAGAFALLFASLTWSIASVLMRKLPLPPSKAMSSAAQMLVGGGLLFVAAATAGEFRGFRPQAVSHQAWFALLYLIVAGSIVGFTAYVWLIHHQSPTLVGTYAYVNPVVAVLLGYFAGGEALGARTVLGTACVLVSVLLITTSRGRKPVPAVAVEEAN